MSLELCGSIGESKQQWGGHNSGETQNMQMDDGSRCPQKIHIDLMHFGLILPEYRILEAERMVDELWLV